MKVRSKLLKVNDRLRQARIEAGHSQADLAILAHVPETVISKLECGRTVNDDAAKDRLAAVLNKRRWEIFDS